MNARPDFLSPGALVYREAFLSGLTPDPDHTVDQWADNYRFLSQRASAEPGRWRTSRTPYLAEIMAELSPSSSTEEVVFVAGAQVGKSELGMNWLGFIMHMAPGPVMAVQPTIDMAKRFSKQRVAPMVEETPVLRNLVSENKSRDDSNTMLAKTFPGGFLLLTGANSPTGLRSTPIRYLFADEIDAWPLDVGGEGDPLQLAIKRTTTFSRRKIYKCSTPTTKDTSRIEREFLNTDQRRYFVPCPHCDHMQFLKWSNIKWTDENPDSAAYLCEAPDCGALIDERHKTDMLARGEWRATAPQNASPRSAGFHISALYSPLGWKSWAGIVREFLEAKGDASLLKTWVNTVLGESWEDEYSAKLNADGLESRVELYQPGVAPAGVLLITAGVDVQDDRLEITRYGWGRNEEVWTIDHERIYGDPAKPELWKQLDEVLFAKIEHEIAEALPITVMAIDSGGHYTNEVYNYARERRKYGVIPIKGQSQRNKPIIGKPSKVDVNTKGVVLKNGVELYPVGSDTAKTTIYARLKNAEAGPGAYHFHGALGSEFFAQLTAEKQIIRYVKGFPVREWTKKPGTRNEVLDCAVYALAALHFLYMRYSRKTIWDQFERKLNITRENTVESGDKQDINSESETNPADKLIKRRARNTMKRTNFVTGFK